MVDDNVARIAAEAKTAANTRAVLEKIGPCFNGHDVATCHNVIVQLADYMINQLPPENRLDIASSMAAHILTNGRMSIREPVVPRLPGLGGKPAGSA